MALIPVEDALARVLDGAAPVSRTERVPISQAAGRILAENLVALRTQPPFNGSAMDGYAVRADDISQLGVTLEVIGESAAGRGFGGPVGKGEAIRIFTGAPMPEGADSVIIQEDTEQLSETSVRILTSCAAGQNVREAGIDFTEGQPGLAAGQKLDPAQLMLAAAMNHAEVPVIARPKVAILATGDELKLPGSSLSPGQIIASNTFAIAALAQSAGAQIIDLGIAEDTRQALDSALDSAISQGADVLVTIGGASVGEYDLVQDAMKARGMTLDFWKIAMRPGKPFMSGRLGDMRILGLPGNPASSLVCGYLFLEPLVAELAGRTLPSRIKTAILNKDLRQNDMRQDYLRAGLSDGPDGTLIATPASSQDSSIVSVFAASDCLIIRPPFAPAANTGDICSVLTLNT